MELQRGDVITCRDCDEVKARWDGGAWIDVECCCLRSDQVRADFVPPKPGTFEHAIYMLIQESVEETLKGMTEDQMWDEIKDET